MVVFVINWKRFANGESEKKITKNVALNKFYLIQNSALLFK